MTKSTAATIKHRDIDGLSQSLIIDGKRSRRLTKRARGDSSEREGDHNAKRPARSLDSQSTSSNVSIHISSDSEVEDDGAESVCSSEQEELEQSVSKSQVPRLDL
jgi:hypothetical protein